MAPDEELQPAGRAHVGAPDPESPGGGEPGPPGSGVPGSAGTGAAGRVQDGEADGPSGFQAPGQHSLLLVDDDAAVLRSLGNFFERRGFVVEKATTARDALEAFRVRPSDVVLLDLVLPDRSGFDVLAELPTDQVPVILFTGKGDVPHAERALRLGAENFLAKPVDLDHLARAVERALEKVRLRREQAQLREAAFGRLDVESLGTSPEMRELARHVELAAGRTGTPVLVSGEVGTGKGWLARLLHELSPRREGPFIEVKAGALQDDSLAELFGAEPSQGDVKRGLLEAALGGTLFLDNVADLAPGLQPHLLDVLESGRFRRVGGEKPVAHDLRIVSAASRDLAADVEAGRFSADLHHRLAALPIHLPPLRERRPEDRRDLVLGVIRRLQGDFAAPPKEVAPEALEALVDHDWPGNLREVRNVLERALMAADGQPRLEPAHLPAEIREGALAGEPPAAEPSTEAPSEVESEPPEPLEVVERRHIERALRYRDGDRTKAAQDLRIPRATLIDKIERYGIEC